MNKVILFPINLSEIYPETTMEEEKFEFEIQPQHVKPSHEFKNIL